ncbi:ogr/Delta-like zinc finger family protein [Acidovorax sp. SUPP1855]|nr:ogr/Delta-like zinc finger family protein [Acidovorax sp. SUPP1855]
MAYTRTSGQLTVTSRETVFACRNPECGHTFTAVTEINRTLSPSAIPDPKVVLPISSHVQRALLQHQLQTMPGAAYTPSTRQQTGDLFEASPAAG